MAVSPRKIWLLALTAALACGKRDEAGSQPAPEPAPTPAIAVDQLSIDTAARPRDGRPFIAGEKVRIGLAIDGGTGPYQVRVTATTGDGGPAAIDASADLEVSDVGEAALAATLDPKAASGVYRLTVEARDATGATGAAEPIEIRIVGEGVDEDPEGGPVALYDAGGRRRARFYWGETIAVRAELGEDAGEEAMVRIWDPRKQPIAAGRQPIADDGTLELTVAIPRLARAGTYGLQIDSAGGRRARRLFRIDGRAFEPVDALTVAQLELRGGADRRAPRTGIVHRGETLVLEALVGGGRERVGGTVRLHKPGGPLEVTVEPVAVADPSPDARIYLTGELTVPKQLAPGRHHLEFEVTEGDRVASVYREILVR